MAQKKSTEVSVFTILNNWLRDGNMNSPYPEELKKSNFGIPFFLYYFLPSSKYFVWINKLFNNYTAMEVDSKSIMMLLKLIYKNTGFAAFQKKYATEKENELIKILWRKYPYYKKEDIEYCVEFIDKDEEIRDNVYEMFGLLNKPKIKKLTKAEVNKRKQHVDSIIKSDDVLDLL